jgi:WD40 repeat protein
VSGGGYPSLQYRSGSQPAEYLVLIDRVCQRDHQAHFFKHICSLLAQEDILLDICYYQRNPDLFWKKVASPPITSSELATLYPNHRLVILGDGQHFVDAVTGDLTEHAWELQQWTERAILSPSSTADWGYREARLARHFRFMPASVASLRDLVEQFRRDEPRPLRSWLRKADKHTPLQEDELSFPAEEEAEMLRSYLSQAAYRWVACCALYPELQWDMSIHIAKRLIEAGLVEPSLLNEENILQVSRLAMFRKGLMRDNLRLALVSTLNEAEEQVARKAIVEVMEAISPLENTVAGYEHTQRWTVQQWELRRLAGKSRRDVSDHMEDMLRRGEVQDPVVLHFLQNRKAGPLDFILPDSWRKVLYPKGISMLGAKARLVGLLALPLLLGLLFYQPPEAQQITQSPNGKYICLTQAADSARYLNYLGCQALGQANNDPQAFAKAYNYFNEALAKSDSKDLRVLSSYHRGLASFSSWQRLGGQSSLKSAKEDFRQAVAWSPPHFPEPTPRFAEDIIEEIIYEKNGEKRASTELLRPDGQEVLRIQSNGELSLGSFDETTRRSSLSTIKLARYAPYPQRRFASLNRLDEINIHHYDGSIVYQLPTGLHQGEIRQLAFSPSASYLATSADDRTVLIWDVNEQKSLQRLTEHRAPVLELCFTPGEEFIVTAGADGVAIVSELTTGERYSVLLGHQGPIVSVDTWPLAELILTAGSDSSLRLWDYEGNQLKEIKFAKGIYAAQFSQHGNAIMLIDEQLALSFFDVFGRPISPITMRISQATREGLRPLQKSLDYGQLNALSHSADGLQWLVSLEEISSLFKLPNYTDEDSLHYQAQYAFTLAAFNGRQFDIAKARASTLLAAYPEKAELWLIRGLCFWFYPAFDKRQKTDFLRKGISDVKQALALDSAVFDATKPEAWLGSIAYAVSDDSIQEAICRLKPLACANTDPESDPSSSTESIPSAAALFDSLMGPEESDILQAIKDEKVGFVRKRESGGYEMMVPFVYEEAFDFVDGLAAVRQDGKWGFVDENGRQVIAPQYDLIISRPNDPTILACVQKDGKSFCVDQKGVCQDYQNYLCVPTIPAPEKVPELIPKQIDHIRASRTPDGYIITGPFSEGLAPVSDGKRFGYIDETQKLVIPIRYEQAGQFYNGRARVVLEGERFFIDKDGERSRE